MIRDGAVGLAERVFDTLIVGSGPAGLTLALDLARLQGQRFTRALGELPPDARGHAAAFLLAMIDPTEREKVAVLADPQLREDETP